MLYCGAVSLAAYALLAIVSYSDVPHGVRMAMYAGIMLVTTASPAWLLARTRSGETPPDPRAASIALRFAVGFGVLCAIARPIFGADFWYYLAEGRLAAGGGNVYTETLTEWAISGLPIQDFTRTVTMPYGPAWVWISTALSSATGPRLVWEFAAYKSVLFVSWLLTLWLVQRFVRATPGAQFRAVLLLGWLPLPLIASLVDGHNDIVMVVLMTAWLVSGRAGSAWALVGSMLVKYVSAPIVAIAVLDGVLQRSTRMLVALGLAVAATAVVIAVYWQDGALFAGLQQHLEWRIYTPYALFDWFVRARGLPPQLATAGIFTTRALLAAMVVWYAWRFLRAPSPGTRAALVTMTLVAFTLGARRLWSHYLLWFLPALVIASDRLLMALTGPFIALMPFMHVLRISNILNSPGRLTFMLYLGVVSSWVVIAYRARSTH